MSLLDIPDLPMIKILKDCNFMSLMILRKTCHNLRNFIDYLVPETEVKSIEVDVHSNNIRLRLHNYKTHLSPLDVTYRKCSQGCKLELFENRLKKEWNNLMYCRFHQEKVTKYIRGADFVDVFCMDLAVIMRMQRTELDRLQVSIKNTPKKEPKKIYKSTGLMSFLGCCSRSRPESKATTEESDPDRDLPSMCNRVYDTIEISLQPRPLRVKQAELSATGQRQLMQILPYTDSNVLNCLSIHCFPNQLNFYDDIDLEIDDLVKLKQWKMTKRLCITGFKLKSSMEDFVHFESVQVKFDVVTANQFSFLKEKFQTTPNLSRFLLYFNTLQDPDNFNETVGLPIHPNFGIWEFPVLETNQYLCIKKYGFGFVFEKN